MKRNLLCVGSIFLALLFPAFAFSMPVNSLNVVSADDLALFHIRFDLPPDFHALDYANRQKDEFQFFVDASNVDLSDSGLGNFYDAARDGPNDGLTIIRGSEIHVSDKIVVRDIIAGYDVTNDINSGGWGPVRDKVDYFQFFRDVVFAIPLDSLKDDDGLFSFGFETYSYGGLEESTIYGHSKLLSASVPEPGSLALLAGGMVGLGVVRRLRKRFV